MKKTILIILIITCSISTINAQNFLKSLYNLEKFPEKMEKSKKLIEEICSDILIYNFINGGNNSSQFDIKSKNGVKFKFPFKDDFYLEFFDKKTKESFKTYTFHINYEFKYLNYYDEFELNDSIYSMPSIFDLAIKYYSLDEYSLIDKILFHYKSEMHFETKLPIFFKDLSSALKLEEIPDFNEILNDGKSENLMSSEIKETMLDAILEETEYEFEEITSLIFDFFILNKKSKTKTIENLRQVFENDKIVNIIETDILQPKINIALNQGGYFNVPKKYLVINQSEFEALHINSIGVRIDFKNNKILIDFKSKNLNNITIKKALLNDKVIKEANINTKKVSLEITENELKFTILKYNPYRSLNNEIYEIELKR
jgi:hypothetical protein